MALRDVSLQQMFLEWIKSDWKNIKRAEWEDNRMRNKSMTEILVAPGRYQHYKGKYYQVLLVARHSETLEQLVVYQAEYESTEFGEKAIWVRPLSMFLGQVIVGGKKVPRFKRVMCNF